MHTSHTLSHADAAMLIDAVRKELEAGGLGGAVAVVDAHGELLAFLRTDGCPLASINISINKAFTAARERRESRAVGNQAQAENFPVLYFGDVRYVGWGGGVPIVYQGQVIGGVGVSGLPEQVDMDIARRTAALIGS